MHYETARVLVSTHHRTQSSSVRREKCTNPGCKYACGSRDAFRRKEPAPCLPSVTLGGPEDDPRRYDSIVSPGEPGEPARCDATEDVEVSRRGDASRRRGATWL